MVVSPVPVLLVLAGCLRKSQAHCTVCVQWQQWQILVVAFSLFSVVSGQLAVIESVVCIWSV